MQLYPFAYILCKVNFCATMAELSSYNKNLYNSQMLIYLLSGSLEKTFVTSDLIHIM